MDLFVSWQFQPFSQSECENLKGITFPMQPAWVVCIYTGSLQISSTVSSLATHSQSNVWLWKAVPGQSCNVPCRTTRWTGISHTHILESSMYEVSMEWMNCIQSRKLSEYCLQLFCEWLLGVFHFSGIECTDSRNLEPWANGWKTSLCATQDNVKKVSSCRNRLDVLERRWWRLAHPGCKSAFCTWSKKKKNLSANKFTSNQPDMGLSARNLRDL